jgi:hypothetical protein
MNPLAPVMRMFAIAETSETVAVHVKGKPEGLSGDFLANPSSHNRRQQTRPPQRKNQL